MAPGSESGSRVSKSSECHGRHEEFIVFATQNENKYSSEKLADTTVFSVKNA